MAQADLEEKYREDLHNFYLENVEEVILKMDDIPALPVMNLTGSQHMNKFFSMTILCSQGLLDPLIYRRFFIKELYRFFSCYNKFMDSYNPEEMPEDIVPFANMVKDSFAAQERALAYIVAYFNTGEPAFLADALVRGTFAVNAIYNSWESFSTRTLPSLAKLCDDCGGHIGFVDIVCPSCGNKVSLSVEEAALEFAAIRMYVQSTGMFESSPFPGCVADVYDCYVSYKSGEMPLEEFMEHLDWVSTQYSRAHHLLERQSASPHFEDDVLEKFYMILSGAIDVIAILEKIRNSLAYSKEESIPSYWPNLLIALKLIYRGYDLVKEGDSSESSTESST